MRVVRVEEYQRIPVGAGDQALRQSEMAQLLAEWRRATRAEPDNFFALGAKWLQPKGWSGSLVSSDLTLQVLPRGALHLSAEHLTRLDRNLGQMLSVSLGDRSLELDQAELSTAGSRYERAVESLCDLILALRRRHKLRAYSVREAESPTVHGRLRFPQQAILAVRRPGLFHSTWVELSEDTAVNRFLRSVIEVVSRRVSGQTRRLAESVLAELSAAPASEPRAEYERIRLDRLSGDYLKAVSLARAVLDGEIPGLYVGTFAGRSEVMLMSGLFDDFVSRLTVDAARAVGLRGLQKQRGRYLAKWQDGPYIGRQTIELVPDAEVSRAGEPPTIIVDAKWKPLAPGKPGYGIAADDVYQMLAYRVGLSCPRAILVYPTMSSALSTQRVRFRAGAAVTWVDVDIVRLPLLWDKLAEPVKLLSDVFRAAAA
jgi:5-methylcytosine-specific restriction endonuclease McrBC regulatory subunit McrC